MTSLLAPLCFTYLDIIDPSISFEPVMAQNFFFREEGKYSLFTSGQESEPSPLPGYNGRRCIIEMEMARALSSIQKKLLQIGLGLKIYDAYRPQKTVDYFIKWMEEADTPLAKKYHYPHEEKKLFHERSYLSKTSSHTFGTAVDITIIDLDSQEVPLLSKDFLGLWDPQSLDMGVGYLCFDERSCQSYKNITQEQLQNREFLRSLMFSQGFKDLETEFWHYYYKQERNLHYFFNFDVRDDYPVDETGQINFQVLF